MASDQVLNNVVQTLTNVAGDQNIGTAIPPKLNGEFRVPFVKNLRLGPVEVYLGGTQYTLLWDEPDDLSNVSHFNIYVVGALGDNTSPIGPYSAQRSPGVCRIVTTTASVLTFFIQTQLSNGNCSELDRSPSVTAQSASPTINSTALPTPGPASLGGVTSAGPIAHQWINTIATTGIPALSQPAFTDISGTLGTSQGGTGLTSSFTDGQLLVGKTATGGLAAANITAGTNITVTNGSGTVALSTGTAYTLVGSGYSILSTDYIVEIQAGTFTVTLPSAATCGVGKIISIANSGAGTITVNTTGGDGIQGGTPHSILPLTTLTVRSNGVTTWLYA